MPVNVFQDDTLLAISYELSVIFVPLFIILFFLLRVLIVPEGYGVLHGLFFSHRVLKLLYFINGYFPL